MRLRLVALAVLVAAFILPGCHPMENKDLANTSRDDTSKIMKKAGGDDTN